MYMMIEILANIYIYVYTVCTPFNSIANHTHAFSKYIAFFLFVVYKYSIHA